MGDIRGAVQIGSPAASDTRTALSIIANRVTDGSINSMTPVAMLSVTDWRDTDGAADLITAPALASLVTRGNVRLGARATLRRISR